MAEGSAKTTRAKARFLSGEKVTLRTSTVIRGCGLARECTRGAFPTTFRAGVEADAAAADCGSRAGMKYVRTADSMEPPARFPCGEAMYFARSEMTDRALSTSSRMTTS